MSGGSGYGKYGTVGALLAGSSGALTRALNPPAARDNGDGHHRAGGGGGGGGGDKADGSGRGQPFPEYSSWVTEAVRAQKLARYHLHAAAYDKLTAIDRARAAREFPHWWAAQTGEVRTGR